MSISSRFTPETYDLLNHNCNHFSQEAAQFLLNRDIPDHITSAGTKVQSSCLGRVVIWGCSLQVTTRAALMTSFEAFCALIAMILLLSIGGDAECPAGPDPTINFGVFVFFMIMSWGSFVLLSLFYAKYLQRRLCSEACQRTLEIAANIVLVFLLYTVAIALSVMHSSLHRIFDGCNQSNLNFRLLSAALGFSWVLIFVGLISKLTNRISGVVQQLVPGDPLSQQTNQTIASGNNDQQ